MASTEPLTLSEVLGFLGVAILQGSPIQHPPLYRFLFYRFLFFKSLLLCKGSYPKAVALSSALRGQGRQIDYIQESGKVKDIPRFSSRK